MPAWIAGGAAVLGDLFSSAGQASTNKANMALQMQSEQWQEAMSDTAVQRRAVDLRDANLNPMLAVGNPASSPSISPATMQNPNAAAGNLGGQISSAMQLKQQQSQIDLANAQADKAKADTGLVPVQAAQIQANTGLSLTQAQQVQANIDLIRQQVDKGLGTAQAESAWRDVAGKAITQRLQDQDMQIKVATKDMLIRATNDENWARAIGFKNAGEAAQKLGPTMDIIDRIARPLSSAAGAAGSIIK